MESTENGIISLRWGKEGTANAEHNPLSSKSFLKEWSPPDRERDWERDRETQTHRPDTDSDS